MISFLLFTFIAGTTALRNNDGPCPTVYPVNNLNYTRFTNGKWYEMARYDNGWQGRSDCSDIEYVQRQCGTTYRVTSTRDDQREFYEGNLPTPRNSRSVDSVNHISDVYRESEGFSELRTSVLDTDYENYSFLYSCQFNEFTNTRSEYSWLMSRSSEMTASFEKSMERFFRYNGAVDSRKYIWSGYSRGTCS